MLIDPAAHGGHGVTDLAMLALFGCPGRDRLESAYAEAAGLDPGWRSLVGLHQLHPLATHAASHGPAYAAELVDDGPRATVEVARTRRGPSHDERCRRPFCRPSTPSATLYRFPSCTRR